MTRTPLERPVPSAEGATDEERSRVKWRNVPSDPPAGDAPPRSQPPSGELAVARAARIDQLLAEASELIASLDAGASAVRMLRTAIVRRDGVLLEALLKKLRDDRRR